MKKTNRKMSLNRETLAHLTPSQLQFAVGGAKNTVDTSHCSRPCSRADSCGCPNTATGSIVGCGGTDSEGCGPP